MIRLGAIGCGDIAQRARLPDLLQYRQDAQLVAIAGRDPTRLRACAEAFDVPRTYLDTDALLAEPDIDGVLILTPPSTHAELALAAVSAGKHVLIEKPMTTTLEDAKRVLKAVETRPVVFSPLPDVTSAEHDLVKRMVDRGAVGQVTGVECHRGHRGPTHAGWFYRKEIAGGGVLLDLGIYGLTEIASLFGPGTRLSSLCETTIPERTLDDGSTVAVDVEDVALVNIWLERGITATVHATWNGYLSHHETRTRSTIFGREGMLAYGVPGGGVYLHRPDRHLPRWRNGGRTRRIWGQGLHRGTRYALGTHRARPLHRPHRAPGCRSATLAATSARDGRSLRGVRGVPARKGERVDD